MLVIDRIRTPLTRLVSVVVLMILLIGFGAIGFGFGWGVAFAGCSSVNSRCSTQTIDFLIYSFPIVGLIVAGLLWRQAFRAEWRWPRLRVSQALTVLLVSAIVYLLVKNPEVMTMLFYGSVGRFIPGR